MLGLGPVQPSGEEREPSQGEASVMASPTPPMELFPGCADGDPGPLTWCLCRQALLSCSGSAMVWGCCGVSSEVQESHCQQGRVCISSGAQTHPQPGLRLQELVSGQPESHIEAKWTDPCDK